MTTRHEFLEQLHELLKPTTYLETGVQHGWSFQLSNAPISIGVDPNPLPSAWKLASHSHVIYDMTSDDFFSHIDAVNDKPRIDFAFIDGMHLAEFAYRDFVNIERYSHPGTVVVFDDVLPTTTDMAAREMCPGDWTGDVWRVPFALRQWDDLVVQWVDTTPTGTCVVTGFGNQAWRDLRARDSMYEEQFNLSEYVLDRRHAWNPVHVLENLRDRGFAK